MLIFVPKVFMLRHTGVEPTLALSGIAASEATSRSIAAPPGVDVNEELQQENIELRERLHTLMERLNRDGSSTHYSLAGDLGVRQSSSMGDGKPPLASE